MRRNHTSATGVGTTRAPCTGPLATRTVRQTPAPDSSVPTSTAEGADDIGFHLIHASSPLETIAPPVEHKQVPVDTKVFDGYLGRYQMAPNFIVSITRDGDHLFAQATGQGKFEIFPESEKEYFAKIGEIGISFKTDVQGRATELVIHQAGANTPAKRIE